MVDFVATATFQDNLSSGADAATAALNRMADAADKQTAAVTRAGPSADALVRRFDPATVAANKLAKAQNDLAIATATMDTAVASGTKTVDQRNAVVEGAASKVQALTQATANSLPATAAMTDSHGKSAAAAGGAALAHAGFTREIVILGHEVISGNFSRIPGSMVVLAERSGELNNIIKALGGFIFGLPGAALAATAGLAAMGYMAESNERQLLGLQTALRGTRDDFVSMAAEANAAARAVAATSGVSLSDSRASAQTFASVPNFQGSQQQLQALIRESNDLASVMGVTVPEAAAKLAAAIKDPAKAAQEWADSHSFGMTQALADQIKLMQDSGDKAGAFGLELDKVKEKTAGAADAAKTDLQKALQDLSKQFVTAGADGESFASSIGKGMQNVAITAVEQIGEIVGAMEKARQVLNGSAFGGNNTGISTPSFNQINDLAEKNNFAGNLDTSSTQADFAVKIAKQESGGRQFNNDGSVITSSAGALGEFQLMPNTAAGLGVDPTTQAGNVTGGLKYISQLWAKYNGDPALVAMAYNWGPGNVDQFIAGTKSIGQVPNETKNFVQNVAGVSINSIPTHGGVIDVSGRNPDSNGIANSSVIDDALKRIGASTTTGQSLSAQDNIKDDIAALAALAAQGITTGESVTKLNEDLQKQQLALQNAIAPAKALIDSLNRQTAGNNAVSAAYEISTSAGLHAENELKAQTDARTKAAEGSAQYQAIVVAETAALDNNTKSAQQRAAVTTAADQQQQLQYLSAELSTLGESADVRARDLAVLKERQAIQKSMPDIDAAEKQKLLDNAAAIADATTQMQRQQQAAQELGNVLTQAFDQVGSAITQAFVNGNGAAVNFGNVARAVMASVLQEVVKLAIINPILNSVTGGNATTLSGVLGVIGGAGTAASGSSGSGGSAGGTNLGSTLLSGASTASSISGAFGGPTIGSSLGLTGPNGVLSGLGSSVGGLFSTGASASTVALSNAPLAAGVAGPVATGGIGEGAGLIGGVQNSVVAGLGTNVGIGSATVGSAFTGVGAGFAAGSLAGGLIQGSLNKTGPGPEAGAAAGAVTGAIIGSVIPVIGTIIGGLIGGIVGGAGGGLIGPHVANPFLVGNVTTQGGQLGLTNILSQKEDDQAIKFIQQTQAEIAQINALLSANGATVNASGLAPTRFEAADTAFNIGNSPNGNLIPTLDAGFSALRFSSSNADTNGALQGRSFIDPTALQNFFTAQQQITAFLSSVSALTKNLGVTTGTFADSVTQLNSAYAADKANADALIATGDLSTTQTNDLIAAEQTLSGVRDKSISQVEEQIQNQLSANAAGLQSRYLNAAASISGNPADAANAALFAFDVNAGGQRQQLDDSMKAIFGDSYATTAQFAIQSAALESTLGEERLAIQTQYNNQIAQASQAAAAALAQQMDQARQAATGVVNNIGSYVTQLQGGSASPLSPTAKYGLAGSQFNTAAAAAEHGDATALQGITGFADSFLQSSQAVNGSGLAYVGDFNRVLAVLSDLASQTPDALTAAVYTAETRTQTQTLSDALDSVKAEVVALRLTVAQGSAAPARIG